MIKANNITYRLIKPHLTYVNYFLKTEWINLLTPPQTRNT